MTEKPIAHEPFGFDPSSVPPDFRSGLVSLVGLSNVGKSTLLNQMLGTKVAIVSPKPQTTRTRITGILTRPDGQIVFIDTPGIHQPRFELNRRMLQIAIQSLQEIDLICWVIDVTREGERPNSMMLELLKPVQEKTPIILAINKIDKIQKIELLPVIDRYRYVLPFKEIVPVSALRGTNVGRLVDTILSYLPEGPPLYPPGQITDMSEEFMIGELIREKIFRILRQEVPYCTAVHIQALDFQEEKNLLIVSADIWVEKPSQKGILIGKGGKMIKQIGTQARKEIEALLGVRVYLELQVRVKEKWRQRAGDLDLLGIRI